MKKTEQSGSACPCGHAGMKAKSKRKNHLRPKNRKRLRFCNNYQNIEIYAKAKIDQSRAKRKQCHSNLLKKYNHYIFGVYSLKHKEGI